VAADEQLEQLGARRVAAAEQQDRMVPRDAEPPEARLAEPVRGARRRRGGQRGNRSDQQRAQRLELRKPRGREVEPLRFPRRLVRRIGTPFQRRERGVALGGLERGFARPLRR
jgi:hypothetical protein